MKKNIFITILVFSPLFVFAQGLDSLLFRLGSLVIALVPMVVGLALLFFLWGLATFILKSGDSGAQEEGKNKMIWGIVALFVMISVWGLVVFVQRTLGIDSQQIPVDVRTLVPR